MLAKFATNSFTTRRASMDTKIQIETLISKYSKHLESGIRIEKQLKLENSPKADCQKDLNKIWRYVLKDLREFVDKSQHESRTIDKPKRS